MTKQELDNKLKFGDYVSIEQKRYGVDNEQYTHKVIGVISSNYWVDVPVERTAIEYRHGYVIDVVQCICCGIDETNVLRYRYEDVIKV